MAFNDAEVDDKGTAEETVGEDICLGEIDLCRDKWYKFYSQLDAIDNAVPFAR